MKIAFFDGLYDGLTYPDSTVTESGDVPNPYKTKVALEEKWETGFTIGKFLRDSCDESEERKGM